MERLADPERIAIAAFVCILNRQRGRDAPLTLEWLKQHSKDDVERAIRIIRETPELQREGYPVEDIVRLLREEVMGEESDLLQEISAEARAAFPERFTGKPDREVIREIAGVVRRSMEVAE